MGGSLIGVASTPPSSISPLVLESLCRYQRSLGELLRHFWACFPVVNSQLELKVEIIIFVLLLSLLIDAQNDTVSSRF